MKKMVAVITGDIINSRKVHSSEWLPDLKNYFSKTVNDTEKWEIYRGDSFQLEVDVIKSLEITMSIKALIKSKSSILDVRMSIGIGNKQFEGSKITESYGSAYINSGESFEMLKNNTLILKTPFHEINEYFNPILKLISFITDNWKPATATTIFLTLNNQELKQKEIAKKMSKDTTTVNKALKRGAYDELTEALNLYSKKISKCLI